MSGLDYMEGRRSALRSTLSYCLHELGSKDIEAEKARWIVEREAVISALRAVCEDFGDNNWDETIHLADVINKHLTNHLMRKL